MTRKPLTFVAVASLLLAAFAAGFAAVPALADAGNESTIKNATLDVSDDTESVRVIAENVTNDTAQAYVYGINDSTGNLTLVDNGTLTTNESGGVYTDTYEYAGVNASVYSQYKVNVTGDGADSIEIAKVNVVSGGTGFLGGGSIPMVELVAGAAVVLVGLALVVSRKVM